VHHESEGQLVRGSNVFGELNLLIHFYYAVN
jgi:hypothetical protein